MTLSPSPASSNLQSRLSDWPGKAPKIGLEGNNLLRKLQDTPMGKMAVTRLPQRAQLGPLIFPNGFLKLEADGLYHVTHAGTAYLEKLRAAGFLH